MNIIGIDLGGSKIHLAKFDKNWQILQQKTVPTQSTKGMNTLIDQLAELIHEYTDSQTKAISIGVPGPIINGKISKFPNIPKSTNSDLKAKLEKKLSTSDYRLSTNIYNDANCFTVGAWQLSKVKKKQNIIGLTLGTGVGGGIIINGQLLTGKDGSVGEFGHMTLHDGKTLEELVSGTAISKRWGKTYKEKKKGEELLLQAKNGDKKTLRFLERIGRDLERALHNLILIFNPDAVFLGGSVSTLFPYFKAKNKGFLQKLPFPKLRKTPIIVIHHQNAATFGAAWLAIHQENP